MANPTNQTGHREQRPQRPTTVDEDMSREDQRDMRQRDMRQRDMRQTQQSGRDEDRGTPDRVEIGDPVPEDNRTIKAGETGEDEDLPGSDSIQETGEDEDLPGATQSSRDERH